MRVLFASSEIHPLMKTGGLADVSASLPQALFELGVDIRLVMPAYADTLARLKSWQVMSELKLGLFGMARLLRSQIPGSRVPLYLVEHPSFSTRTGNPYNDTAGHAWPDNAERFTLFCRACEMLALNQAMLDWQPDIVHGNDWQTGILLSLLRDNPQAPPSLMTIHNLAYQGVFNRATFDALGLPARLWRSDALEHWGEMNCLKAGLNAARKIATVSPSYAREIQTTALGAGLDGLLRHRQGDVLGMINGIDMDEWNPAKDVHLPATYSPDNLANKSLNKQLLQREMGLNTDSKAMLIGMVGRMTEQKGLDVVLTAAEQMMQRPVQLAMLGGGDIELETAFSDLMQRHPGRLSVRLGYNEGLAHRIEAGSDVFLMPSRFEPCGLNQLYSLRYGTPPIVHGVGGLNDTVIDTYETTLADGTANGFVMRNLDDSAILWGVNRALEFFQQPKMWATLQAIGMAQDFSWVTSAQRYLDIYQELGQKIAQNYDHTSAAAPIAPAPEVSPPPPPKPTRSRAARKA